MARIGRGGFIVVAVIFHLIYVFSIFDIYFVSPIVSGMRPFKAQGQDAPAKRLVLFVGDGLRADKAFQSFPDPSPNAPNTTEALTPRPLAPFLRSRVLSHGTFGVSHTRVPTESRPGHVALIAGLYEDVSAVTTGWKLNPVNFDSVFNRSRHTWSWGSPDILPMFKEGAVPGRVDAYTYAAEEEDFTLDGSALDVWVFERVKKFFKEAKQNATLNEELRKEQNVFFLHLLGLDTTGHGKRPYSKEYLHNIQIVDQGVEEITHLIEEFYGDDQTAFVFTADHGMSDWGSHGDGHPDNTRTPLIAWGSGVAEPHIVKKGVAAGHEDGLSLDWGLEYVQRHDVAQADVAALMAYLAGLEFPVNSVGELPLSYLTAGPSERANALLANAKGILEMYRVKEEKKQAATIQYQPFNSFAGANSSAPIRTSEIEDLIKAGHYEEAIEDCEKLIKIGLEGLRYLQTYDWLFLRTLVTAGYLGWIAFAITTVIDLHVLHGKTETSRTTASIMAFSSIGVILYSILIIQRSSWTYYAYVVFPVVFWEEVYARRSALIQGRKVLLGHLKSSRDLFAFFFKALAFIGLLEALVQSYFHREVYTICYVLAIAWPLAYGPDFIAENFPLIIVWAVCCACMSLFTLLPVVKVEDMTLILIAGGLMLGVGLLYLLLENYIMSRVNKHSKKITQNPENGFSRGILGAQVGLVALAMLVTRSSIASLSSNKGLPLGTQAVGWIVLVSSLLVPFLHGLQPNNNYLHRLMVIFLTFSPIFVILTISYEGLFYFTFCATLATWVQMEHYVYAFQTHQKLASSNGKPSNELNPLRPATQAAKDRITAIQSGDYRSITLSDARIALFFFYFLQSGFFSVGNISSISTFSLDAVFRLIPIFDPFSQGALLMLKILIPFAVISANLGILNRSLGVAPSALFMIVMAISDVMTLNFFYMVKDEGSWLDIGTTITHFGIASALCIFVAGLEFISEVFVSGVEFDPDDLTYEGDEKARKMKWPRGIGQRDPQETTANGVHGDERKSENMSNGNGYAPEYDYMGRKVRR